MGVMATVRVNTTQAMILYWDFVIEESTDGWEWTHEDYSRPGTVGYHITGTCQTVFECIEAVDAWQAEVEGEAA